MILYVFKCQNSSLDYFDTGQKFIGMEQSIMTKLLMNARKKTIRQHWILVRRDEEGLRQCSSLVDRKNGYQFWQKVEDKRKGFNIA